MELSLAREYDPILLKDGFQFFWVNPDFSKGIGFEIDTDLSLRPCEQGQ
jgi:hypothetical protein